MHSLRRCAAAIWPVVAALLLPPSAASASLSAEQRRDVFQIVWTRVRDRHMDPKLGGVDWNRVRRIYAPKAARAKSDGAFYDVLRAMLGELHQSHFGIIPPEVYLAEDEGSSASIGAGTIGASIRLVEGKAVVTVVEPDSAAARAGVKPGWALAAVDGKPLAPVLAAIAKRKLRPAQERLQALLAVLHRTSGAVGSTVKLELLDADDRPVTVSVERELPRGDPVTFGQLPTIYTQFEAKRLAGGVGYIRFNVFLMPLLARVQQAVAEMKDAPGLIFDLRANPGGLGAMASAVAATICRKRGELGTLKMRSGEIRLPVFPAPDPYGGKVAILTDEMSLSTSEILAGGLQEMGRALVVGGTTGGMALPSVVEKLPGGARLQYAFADFRTPKGVLLEGRGVVPDIPVELTRRALLAGRDPALEAAVRAVTK
jgi:carboxyl-terminal processing protease